jgi:LysR family nitrogen assimilation transcriptional regulator
MDVRQLECFLAVVDHGSVTKAAFAVHLAQPSLSQVIRKLERELQTELFRRVGRGLVLTPAGEALIGPCRQVLRDLAQVRDVAQGFHGLEAGRLDVSSVPTLARDFIAEWVGAFRRRHPGMTVRIDLREDPLDVAHRVRSGSCELGYSTVRVTCEGVVTRVFTEQHLALALPPGSGADLPEPVPLTELSEVPFVLVRGSGSANFDIEKVLAEYGLAPTITVELNDDTSLVPLVLSGAGAAFIPLRLAVEAGRRGATTRSTVPQLSRPLYILYRDGPLSRAAQAFLDLNTFEMQRWYTAISDRQSAGATLLEAATATDDLIISGYAALGSAVHSAPSATTPSASRRSRSDSV